MFTERSLTEHLREISENAKFAKLNYVSSEKFSVLLKCKVEVDQNKSFYDSFVLQWVKKFSKFTTTTWIVRNSFPKLKRILYRKVYTCHRSAFNKKKTTNFMALNQQCKAKIDFKMKFINRNTIKNDPLLKEGLNMTIAIEFLHTHKVRAPESINMLKSTSETDDVFYRYFSMGYSATAAKLYHELVISERYGDIPEFMMNANINPTTRHILYLRGKSKSNNWDNQSFAQLMDPRKSALEATGGFISYDIPEVVILITPIMKRVILAFKLDHIIVDSTDTSNFLFVTHLYIPSKAGALPIVCILHTGKSAACYSQAFLEAKLALEKITNGNIEPKIITIKDCKEVREAVNVICSSSRVVSSKWSVCSQIWRLICGDDIKIELRKRHGLMELFYNMVRPRDAEDGQKYYEQLKGEECVATSLILNERVEQLWQDREEWLSECDSPCMNLVEAYIRITNEFIRARCKCFNVYVMVDVVTNIIENILRGVLLAHAKSLKVSEAYTKLSTTSREVFDANARKIVGTKEFRVEISGYKNTKTVKFRTDTWCCNCPVGKYGRFCEHLSAVINFQETELMKTTELTDEEKCMFTEIAGGEDEADKTVKQIKSEVAESSCSEDEASDNEDDDNKNNLPMEVVEDEQPVSPVNLDGHDNYFYLEVKTERLDSNDPLEEYENVATDQPIIVENNVENLNESTVHNISDTTEVSTVDLKNQYERAMKVLNEEFRRLNNFFKKNPNKSNMETMQRLARELSKIRPIERVSFGDLHITLNDQE